MKIRKGLRKLVIDNKTFQYKIGRGHVLIYDEQDKRHNTDLSKVTGLSWDYMERYEWKKYGSGYCTPATIESYIRNNLL